MCGLLFHRYNLAGIWVPTFLTVGMGEACSIMQNVKVSEAGKLRYLREKLYFGLFEIFPKARLNGHILNRHPGNLNMTIPGLDAK